MEKAVRKYWPVFVLPTAAAFCVGFLYPFIQGLYLSFCSFITIDRAKFNYLHPKIPAGFQKTASLP